MNDLLLAAVISMAGLTIFFASILAFADRKLRVEEDPKIGLISKILPGVNCGACGFLNCHDFAEHIVKEGADPGKCRVLGEEEREELFNIVGRAGKPLLTVLPLVMCAAGSEKKKPVAYYTGLQNCRAANLIFGAGMECEYGCMGFGDCTGVCPFGALSMQDGLPVVLAEKCTGCGKCADACPRNVITMQEKKYKDLFYVACSSHDGALRVRQICGAGCVACGICEKLFPGKYFVIKDNLSRADYAKQEKREEVEKLQAKCPTKVIKNI